MTKEALKLALELKNSASGYWTEKEISIIEKLIEALAQPEQEPVAHCEAGPEYCQQCKLEDRSIVLAAAVRYVKNNTPQLVSDEICRALATPPQRTWVGLTDEEIKSMDAGIASNSSFYAGALWANSKLKEKNTHDS